MCSGVNTPPLSSSSHRTSLPVWGNTNTSDQSDFYQAINLVPVSLAWPRLLGSWCEQLRNIVSVSITGLMELCPTLFTEIYHLLSGNSKVLPGQTCLNFHFKTMKHFNRIVIENINILTFPSYNCYSTLQMQSVTNEVTVTCHVWGGGPMTAWPLQQNKLPGWRHFTACQLFSFHHDGLEDSTCKHHNVKTSFTGERQRPSWSERWLSKVRLVIKNWLHFQPVCSYLQTWEVFVWFKCLIARKRRDRHDLPDLNWDDLCKWASGNIPAWPPSLCVTCPPEYGQEAASRINMLRATQYSLSALTNNLGSTADQAGFQFPAQPTLSHVTFSILL